MQQNEFFTELTSLINRASLERIGNVPDYILAQVAFDAMISFSHNYRNLTGSNPWERVNSIINSPDNILKAAEK